jgi:hypothetical protein
MTTGELLTRWTIRVAMALYLTSITLRVCSGGCRIRLATARLTWVLGCVVFLAHVACAFQFYHAWSHRVAYEHTARQTAEVVGLAWGGGLYVNYVFAGVWAADAAWWLARPVRYLARSRVVEIVAHGFLAFIAFNATVVFGVGAIRWAGVVATVFLVALLRHALVTNRRK